MSESVFEIVGKIIVYVGACVAIAYGFFIFLGKKWIENQFQRRLESYKHEKNKEIENLKYQINLLLSRVTKIHDKEFAVLPEAWNKLYDALELISWFTSPFQQYPDFDNLSEDELSYLVNSCPLKEFQKKELLESKKKTQYYSDTIFWINLAKSQDVYSAFHNFITRNRIFLSPDLREKFMEVDGILWDSLLKKEIGKDAKDSKMAIEAYRDIKNRVTPIIADIETLVQKRLRYDEAM
jgi:hypothetical protein